MLRRMLGRKAPRVAAAALAVGSLGISSFAMAGTAHADPNQFTQSFVGVGSDTIQDIDSAFTGFVNNTQYGPLISSGSVLASWNATGTGCITPKAPGASFNRPNGSGAGQKALSRAIDGAVWGVNTDPCGLNGRSVSGLIDYGRSSAAPGPFNNQSNALTFIPFARDGVSYAYATRGGASAITDFSQAELQAIYASSGSGVMVRGTTFVVPCGLNSNSGTKKFWDGIIGGSGNEATATTLCNSPAVNPQIAGLNGRIEENNGAELQQKADSLAAQSTPPNGGSFEVIAAHSAASYIAQVNGKAPDVRGTTPGPIGLGGISTPALGLPYSGSPSSPPIAPSSTFFSSSVFGRFVWHVFDSARVQTGTIGNAALKAMFVGGSSVVCGSSAQATVNAFGFLSIPGTGAGTCGDISQQQDLVTGAS
jgi:hypothetical protein